MTGPTERRRLWSTVVLSLLVPIWTLGTPLLVLRAVLPEPGVDDYEATATQRAWYLLAGLACGLLTPLVGLVIATGLRWWIAAAASVLALVFAVYVGLQTSILSVATARSLVHTLSPPTSSAPPEPRGCQEYSGSDNQCPGD